MWNDTQLQELLKISELTQKQLQNQISIFERNLLLNIQNAPDQDKKKMEELKGMTEQAFNLAKMGKAEEASKLIKDFQNGHKNNK